MHTSARFRATVGAAMLLALASCGGGSSGGSGSAPTAPTAGPAPTPAPTPSPTAKTDPPATDRLPPAPFALQGSATFALVGWQQINTGGATSYRFDQAPDRAALSWSAPDKTYLINLADLGSGKLVYTFPVSGNNNVSFSIIQSNGSVARAYVHLQILGANSGRLHWQSADGVQPFTYADSIFGLPVPAGGLPTIGSKTFYSDACKEEALVIDFASRKVSGSVATFFQGPFSEGPLEKGTIEAADLQPDGTFVAKLSVAGLGTKGELRGRLFGAGTDELGLYWNAPVRDGDGGVIEWRTVMLKETCTGC